MKRVDQILKHPLFMKYIEKTDAHEADRIFCKHNMEHFLAVARIAEILNLKKKLKIKKEYVYAAALLHDVGRYKQYEDGIPHDRASAALASGILMDCGFDDKETAMIVDAIGSHRDSEVQDEQNLRGILYRADKLSRSCFACPVEKKCDRKAEKKNLQIHY